MEPEAFSNNFAKIVLNFFLFDPRCEINLTVKICQILSGFAADG